MAGGTFSGIEMGRLALQNFQTGLHTTGHNISNAKTEGYSKQRVVLRTRDPLYQPNLDRPERAGQIGQGMQVTEIQRVRDEFLDKRIGLEKVESGYWDARKKYLAQTEAVFNEPGSLNLREDLDAFWQGWQEVANNPAERAPKSVLIERAKRISDTVQHSFRQLKSIRESLDREVIHKTKRINEIATTVRDLNKQILQLEAVGDNPNDLYDRRDLLFEELSTLANVTMENIDPNETIVYIGGRHLVQGEQVEKLTLVEDPANEGMSRVLWKTDGVEVNFKGGEMRGLLEVRDVDVVSSINKLDAFALNLAETVNEIHRDGFGVNQVTGLDFFKTLPVTTSAEGNYDIKEDGNVHTVLFKINGTNELNPKDTIGMKGELTFNNERRDGVKVKVPYFESDRVEDVIKRINDSDANVAAYLDHRNRLTIKARVYDDYKQPNFAIGHIEDSSEFLAGIGGILKEAGSSGAYQWTSASQTSKIRPGADSYSVSPYQHPAARLAVNEYIQNDVDNLAVGGGFDTTGDGKYDFAPNEGNNDIALKIAQIKHKDVMGDTHSTFNDFYAAAVADIGAKTETAAVETEKQGAIVGHLEQLRQAVSGVNLDEEMAEMVVYQHGYNAAARVVSTMDRLLDTIINRMGV